MLELLLLWSSRIFPSQTLLELGGSALDCCSPLVKVFSISPCSLLLGVLCVPNGYQAIDWFNEIALAYLQCLDPCYPMKYLAQGPLASG